MKDPNQNRKGYKKTKIGWIPDSWDIFCLKDVVAAGRGIRYGIVQPGEYDPSGRLMIRGQDYSKGWAEANSLFRVNALVEARYKRARVKTKDLVMTIVGAGTGTAIEIPGWLDGANVTQTTARISVDPDKAVPRYCLYCLRGPSGQRQVAKSMKGGAQPGLNCGDVELFLIALPRNRKEQEKIADILFTRDEAIESLDALIEAKQRQKKALTQQLLSGKKRLPGFGEKVARVKYRYFDLPGDWECPHLGEVAEERIERNRAGKHVVLTCSKHRGFVESKAYFKKQVFSEDTSNYKVVRKGWFGFPSNHVEEGSIALLTSHDSGAVSPIYTVFEADERIHPDYLYAVLKTETFRHIFAATTNASVDRRGSLRWDAFAGIRVPCPPLAEQIAVSRVLRDADIELQALEAKRAALERQKKALMQKLLTGEVRVKV